MKVPFTDLAMQYKTLKPEIDRAISEVFDSGYFIGGKPVKEFEHHFASLCEIKNCVAIGNGTDGLFLSLKALGIGPGDEVITPAWSWISTSEVITLAGAKPVFADVDPEYFTITQENIKSKITSRTKAVIVVHLYGQVADVNSIKAICDRSNLFLIEDCSQAHLSSQSGFIAGTTGDCGVFSFYPTKNLGAFGDAGCVITKQDSLCERIRRLANHGGLNKDDHLIEGFNSRMDTIQAAILNVKLKYLKEWNAKRIKNAQLYFENLSEIKSLSLPRLRNDSVHTFHLFVIRVKQRDELKSFLESRGVDTLIHYPKALPFEPAYDYLSEVINDFPVSAQLQNTVLSLPVSPEISEAQILYVCSMIKEFYEGRD
jgi:dTDP-4-amino-4,6-dideoxygalactose transaminase